MDSLEDMREWPRTAVLKLFELVKPHPILYDSKHGNWTNTTEKGRLWTKIAKELDRHLSSKKCRDRFQYNKKKHVRQIRRQIARGDASNVNMDLIWLLDEDGDGEQEISTNDRATDGTKSDSTNDTESGIHSHESIEEAASASRQVPAGLTFIDDPIALETDSGDGEPPSKRRKLETEDECSLFGRLVEIDLRRLDSKKRAKARLDITAILSQICDEGDEIPPTTASPSTAVDPSPSSSKHIKKKRSGNSRTKTKTEDGDASSKSTKSSKMSKLKKLITKSVMKSPKQKKDDKSTKSKKEKSKRG